MATQDQVAAVNRLLPDSTKQSALGVSWDDTMVGQVFDLETTVAKTVRTYWNAVLANTAPYMDVSESGTSRTLSQPWRNAWEMVQRWDKVVAEEAAEALRASGTVSFGKIKRV